MTRSFLQRTALVFGAGLAFLGAPPATANAQKALVYCPVNVDATGCNAIVTALTGPAFPLGVHRGYDGSGGTVDLKAVDLFSYSVFVVPSLADDASSQPYAKLREPEVVEHLRAALIGRIAMWSGTPDQGATNRVVKDALIQNLAGWAAGAYATARGPGLVTLLDASSSVVTRYDWVRAITPVAVTSDANLLIYNEVRALNPRATAILTSGAGPIAYGNMATFGFQVPNGAAGVSLDAVGQTGTTQGGQVVLLTMEAGNTSGATVRTDKDDYAPGETVTITGSGWQPGEQIKLTLHMDPLRETDTELTATANGSGTFTNADFSPGDYDVGVRFVLTAIGQTSGRRAQTTFTDGKTTITGTVKSSAAGNPAIAGATVTCLIADGCNQNETTTTNASGVYTFDVNYSGNSASLKIRASASGFSPDSATVLVNNNTTTTQNFVLSPAVAAPTATNDSYTTNEDQSLTVPAPGVLSNDVGTGPLTAVLVTPPPAAEGTVTLSPNGGFTFNPALNFNGSTSFTYRAQNAGGLSAPATVTITVNAVNDAPSFTKGADQPLNEDAAAQTVLNWATAISAGPADESGQTVSFNTLNNNNPLFSVQPSVASNGTLTYTPAPNAFGTAIVTVSAQDDGGTANGGADTSDGQTFTITINAVNDAPSFAKGADQTVAEDAGPQTVSPWATAISAGPANESGQLLTFVITSNTNLSLFSAGPAVAANGTLTYTPAPNATGTATIKLKLTDDGGVANGGVNESAEQTFVITVNAVNDAPTFVKGADQTVLEDAGAKTVVGWATAISAGPADEASQTLTFNTSNDNNLLFSAQPSIAPNGTLTYTAAANAHGSATVTVILSDNGGTLNGGVDASAPQTFTITVTRVNDEPTFTKGANQSVNEDAGAQTVANWATAISAGPNETQVLTFMVTSDNPSLFSAQPAISPTGTLTYTPAANANGTANVTVVLKDDGGTANGGDDTSPTETFTITVAAVNDAPSFVRGPDQTVLEDAPAQSITPWATAISAGPADEAGQALTFNVSNSNNALFSVQPAVAANGTLTYTPAANQYGIVTVTVSLSDNGGTANGGDDTSDSQTVTITITPVNDVPSFTKGPDQTVNEDAAAQSVGGWATAISAGPNEALQAVDFLVTNGNNALFSVQPAVSPNGALTFTLTPDAFGSATVTVRIHDDGGTANGGVDTSAPETFTITVNPVNDAPAFVKGADQSILEDAGAQTVPGWATSITAGPANESSQTLTFTTSSNNAALFAVAPAIDPTTGALTYTPAANANGTAIVTVTLKDNGGTDNGGIDQSQQTFNVTITAVNDVPSFVKGADKTVLEDAGAQTVAGWATAISKGPADESGQTLTFAVTNDNNALFAAQPAVAANGTLSFTPAANAFGSATVTVILSDDGGTANGGDDTSDPQMFTIYVTPVNDAPLYTLIANETSAEDGGLQTVPGAVTAMSTGPANESSQALISLTSSNNNTALFTATGQPTINLAGTLTYTAAPNANGSAIVTVVLKDDGGTANGGVDQTTKTFMLTITKVNDAPVINAFSGPLAPTPVNTSVTVTGNFTDVDLGDMPSTESHTLTIDWGDGSTSTPTSTGAGTTRNVNASHTYTSPNVYTVKLTVKDAGNLSDEAIYQYIVIYDPSAGFVTGGGWINSPTGAYVANPSLTGKATFGFVSKYKKGQTSPDGNTEFQFHAAGMNFKSNAYEWLVIAGAKAQFKGSGTIDGAGNYGFMLMTIDGQLPGGNGADKFRIKIWDKNNGDAVVYDNQIGVPETDPPATLLGGGSINIQAK